MEALMRAFKKYDRALTIQSALPLSQKERERPRYDKALAEFETAFNGAVLKEVNRHEKAVAAGKKKPATKKL